MIPNRGGDAPDVQFVLFEIARVPFPANFLELPMQFLNVPYSIRCSPGKLHVVQNLFPLSLIHIRQKNLPYGRAIERNRVTLESPKLLDGFFNRFEFFNVGIHGMFSEVHFLR